MSTTENAPDRGPPLSFQDFKISKRINFDSAVSFCIEYCIGESFTNNTLTLDGNSVVVN